MTNQRDLELQIQGRNSSFAIALKPKRGEVVEVNGSIEGDLPYLVWVKPLDTNASPTQMFNPGTVQSLQSGMTVYYRQDPEAPAPWSLVRFDSATYAQDASAFLSLPGVNNPPHANEHIMTPGLVGPDPLNVYSHALVDFAVRPTTPASMRVRVYSGWYPGVTNYELFTGPTNTKDFTSDIPATSGKAILVAICIDSVGVLTYVNGTDYTEGEPIPAASRPDVATNLLLITAVRLVNGMTQITNASFDQEMRPVFAPGGLARTIDAAKVTKLISPDGLVDPVVSADNAGDVTIADGDLIFGAAGIISVTGALQLNATGGIVINESGADVDLRIEGDTEGNVLFLDASKNVVFFGRDDDVSGLALGSTSIVADGSVRAIRDGGTAQFQPISFGVTASANFPTIAARAARGTEASPTAVQTNDILFRMGGAGYGSTGFAGANKADIEFKAAENWTDAAQGTYIRFRTVLIGATGLSERMRLVDSGELGLGLTSPQGKFHTYESISGFIIWEFDGLDATVRTIIPNGTGDILYRLTAMYVLRDSAAAVSSGTTDVSNSASVNLTVGGNTVRLRVNADGSTDIARTAGTDTIKVALVLRWL